MSLPNMKKKERIYPHHTNLRLRAMMVPAKAATPIYTALGRISSSFEMISSIVPRTINNDLHVSI